MCFINNFNLLSNKESIPILNFSNKIYYQVSNYFFFLFYKNLFFINFNSFYINDLNYLILNPFTNFFFKYNLLIPNILKLNKSYTRISFLNKIKKFFNIFMLKGNKEFVIKNFTNSMIFFFIYLNKHKYFSKNYDLINWNLIFFFYNISNLKFSWLNLKSDKEILLPFSIDFLKYKFIYNDKLKLINFFLNIFNKINLIFLFSFHKIDKNLRKYSRKRSGKYKIVFQYLPYYKRFNFLIKLFKKDLKFLNFFKFNDKFFNSMKKLLFNKNKHFIWRIKYFTNSFIFKNFSKKAIKASKF